MINIKVWYPILFIALCSPAIAEEKKMSSVEFYVKHSMALTHFTPPYPDGIETKHILSPSVLGFAFHVQTRPNGGLFADIHAGMLNYTMNPVYGGELGVFYMNSGIDADFGVEFESNGALTTPVNQSMLNFFWWSAFVRVRRGEGIIRPQFDFNMILPNDAETMKLEDITTFVGHEPYYKGRLGVQIHLPLLRAEAGLSIYRTGVTAIASKEFAYPIDRVWIYRAEVGAGVELFGLEVWLRGAGVFPSKADDMVEYFYQAPFIYPENLMVQKSLTGEVRWRF